MASAALPTDVETLQRLLLSRESELAQTQFDLAEARARETSKEAVIAHLQLAIAKLRRGLYGQRSERSARLLDQLEFELEELEATASEDELAAEQAAATTRTTVRWSARKRSSRKPFPEHLPRERIVVPGPTACSCCGSTRLASVCP